MGLYASIVPGDSTNVKPKDEGRAKKLLPRMTSHERNESFYADIYADAYRDFLATTQCPVLLEPSR